MLLSVIYLAYAAEEDLTIRYVTETHIHADFAPGAFALEEATGAELVPAAASGGSGEPKRSRQVLWPRSSATSCGSSLDAVCASVKSFNWTDSTDPGAVVFVYPPNQKSKRNASWAVRGKLLW